MTDSILEKYIQIIESNKKTGDISPDGESTLYIDTYGNKVWRNKQRQLHRRDGPAFEHANGDKSWFINDKRHREDGPAIERVNGDKFWFINDKELSEDEFYAYIVYKAIKRKKK